MKLYLLRHAEAENVAPDELRPLTEKGRKSVIDLANFTAGRLRLDLAGIWHSPLRRAVETASLFKQSAELDAPLIEIADLRPMDDPTRLIQRIEAQHENILIVGHNPHFEMLAAKLLGLCAGSSPINVPKAALLHFKKTGRLWQLRDLLTTKVTGH